MDMVGETFDYAESAINTIKEQVESGIGSLTEQMETWRTEAEGVPKKVQKASPGKSFLNTISQVTEPIQDVIDQVTGNSVVSWVTDKVGELFDEVIEFDAPDIPPNLISAVTDFFAGAVSGTIDELWNTLSQIQEDVANLFAGNFPDISSMNFETIQNLLISMGAGALQGFLNLIKNLILQSLDLAKKLIGFVRNALFTKIRFPFIEKLVKLVSLGTISIDTSFTLVEGIALLLAIPTTISYKLIFEESPLKSGDTLVFPYGAITVQSGTEDALKFSGRVTKLFFTFLRLLTTGIKLGTKVMKLDMAIGHIKWLDFSSIVLGGLSYCGSVLNSAATFAFADPTSSAKESASAMLAIDTLNYFIPTTISLCKWKVVDKEQWKAITAKNKQLTACTTACHLVLRSADFVSQAKKFGSINNDSERGKIAGFVTGTTSGLSSLLAAISTCFDDKNPDGTPNVTGKERQIIFDSFSLGFSVAAIVPSVVEVYYL